MSNWGKKKIGTRGAFVPTERALPHPEKKRRTRRKHTPLVASNLIHSIEAPLFLI
jgi:hypothetical protein